MAKNFEIIPLEQLDKKDRFILYELDINSRQSNAEIGKKIGLDKNTVAYRLGKLARDEIILGFYSVIDITKFGRRGYRSYLKFQFCSPEKKREIIDFVCAEQKNWWVGSIDGYWDLGFVFYAEDPYDFQKFWDRIMEKYQGLIQDRNVSLYPKVFDFNYAFLSPEKNPEKEIFEVGFQGNEKISESERKVLSIISQNARMPTIEIAEKTGLTPAVVKYAIKKLKALKIILGFRARINLNKLGLIHYKFNVYLKDLEKYRQMVEFAKQHPRVIYINEAIGFADFEIEALFSSHKEFQEFVAEIERLFGDKIKDHDYYIHDKIYRINYFED
jgi:DNA-binding Lrp family transcriptional regulator